MRNISIDFFRYVFALEICLWHFLGALTYFNHGHLAVDFFFILSGLFIAKSVLKNPAPSIFDYTFNRLKRFYPKLAVAVLPLVIIAVAKMVKAHTPEAILYQTQRILNEYLFLGGFSIFRARLNGTLWYINVLIIDGAILYAILRTSYKNAINLVLPLAIIFIYTYILNLTGGSLRGGGDFAYPFVNCGHLRGFAAMSVGIMLNEVIKHAKTFFECHIRAFDVLAFLSIAGTIFISIVKPNLDGYIIVFSCFIIISCMTDNSIIHQSFKNVKAKWMGELSLDLYLIHYPVCVLCHFILPKLGMPFFLNILIYLLIAHITAILFGKLCKHFNI